MYHERMTNNKQSSTIIFHIIITSKYVVKKTREPKELKLSYNEYLFFMSGLHRSSVIAS